MTNRQIMMSALKNHTIPLLAARGFQGKYPHFRRKHDDCMELITFQTNKWGGSFTIEVSAVFPNSADSNYTLYEGVTEDTFGVEATNYRYRLPGLFNGWFYYRDVYRKRLLFSTPEYFDVPEKNAAEFTPPKGYQPVQKFDRDTAVHICGEINRQMETAYDWLIRFERRHIK